MSDFSRRKYPTKTFFTALLFPNLTKNDRLLTFVPLSINYVATFVHPSDTKSTHTYIHDT